MSHFHFYTKAELLALTRLRKYETKLGEKVKVLANGIESLSDFPHSNYVCIGIPESIGILGDHGTRGAESTWFHFVQSFLNLQSTDACTGEEIILAGYFDFNQVASVIEKNHRNTEERINACRHAVANIIDDEVEKLIKDVVAAGKIPVVVGGGHNNAYPIIKASAKTLHKKGLAEKPQINAINLSATADYRIMEGRHSGNPFRYAMEEGYLNRYAVIGLQENVNPQSMMDDLYSNLNIHYHTFEEIFIEERINFIQSLAQSYSFIDDGHIAVELDMDAMSSVASSGQNPSGIALNEIRQYIRFSGHYPKVSSLHICEGATDQLHGFAQQLAKLIAFLITDFIKARR
jgi:formiminoglutamase